MKIIIPYLLFLPILTFADQGLLLRHISGIRYSPQYKIYAVITIQPSNGVLTPEKQRVQVFDNETGKLLWSTSDRVSLIAGHFYPSDDGQHIVVVRNDIQRMHYEMGLELTEDMRNEIENAPVLTFYNKDKELKTYTVKELGLKAEEIHRGMSRFSAFDPNSPPINLGDFVLANHHLINPLIIGSSMRIRGVKNQVWYFDITSGNMLEEPPNEFLNLESIPSRAPSDDPFGFWAPRISNSSDDSSQKTDEE